MLLNEVLGPESEQELEEQESNYERMNLYALVEAEAPCLLFRVCAYGKTWSPQRMREREIYFEEVALEEHYI